MTDPRSMTLAEVYALVADLDVISLQYSCPPLGAHWWIGLRTCADIATAEQRVRAQGIRCHSDDERRSGAHFGSTLQVTVWDGPGCDWGIVHVHHSGTPCEAVEAAEPEQDDLFGGAA